MSKKVIKEAAIFAFSILFLGLIAPVFDSVAWSDVLNTYKDIGHWMKSLIIASVAYGLYFYFDKVNPRKMYYCIFWTPVLVVGLAAATMAFLAAIIGVSLIESIVIKMLLLLVVVIIYLFLFYASLCRGMAIYERGKIRIFKFSIKTYKTDMIDDYRFDYTGKTCMLHIVILGNHHAFRLKSDDAARLERKMKHLKCRNCNMQE